ncbi:MAG TPA: hypothetical protein VM076_15980 [Gemmatimonadaceae bacterium]|nr:hypothetical protein [Gemmatimonadaceae bacterium]
MASVEHDDAYRAWLASLSDEHRRATFAAMRQHAMVVVPMVVTIREPSAMARAARRQSLVMMKSGAPSKS